MAPLPTAEVSGVVTILVAFIAAGGAVVAGVWSAIKQSKTMVDVARNDRWASWQMHKREVYAEFLGSVQAALDDPDSAERRARFRAGLAKVELVANPELRSEIKSVADLAALGEEEVWDALVTALAKDAAERRPARI